MAKSAARIREDDEFEENTKIIDREEADTEEFLAPGGKSHEELPAIMSDTYKGDIAHFLEGSDIDRLNDIIQQASALRKSLVESNRSVIMDTMRLEWEKMRRQIQSYGLNEAELFGIKHSSSSGTVAPKYRNEQGDEWTGRGRMPKWLAAAIADGATKEEFLIK